MTQEIRELMHHRRLAKNDPEKYNQIRNIVLQKCKEVKEQWLEDKCQEIERQKDRNPKEIFERIREITGKIVSRPSACINSSTGEVLYEPEDVARRWSEYLGQLFNDFRTNEEFTSFNALSGPPITKDEIRWALHKSKTSKAAGPDEVVTEMLNALGDTGVNILHSLVNKIYDSGEIPNDMLKFVFIALPKKPNTLDCDQHGTISLMSHTLKLLLKIVTERCRSKIRPEIAQCQYGFMPDKGTRNAIFTLRMLSERSIQHQQNSYICFIDYKKAFDRVRHKRLFKILKDVGLDEKDQRIIYNLYHLQKGAIKLTNGLTEWTEINRGVRQGCVMSPDFFNLYSEHILRRLEESNDGVTINGVCINNIRYADGTALIADSGEGLQKLLDLGLDASSDEGLEINCKKTFCMVVSKERQPPTCNLICKGTGIEQVNSFNYLGSMLTSDGRCEKEIRRRIEIAKTSFNQMSPVLKDRKLSIPLKVRLLKCFIWSVLLYGCESWTLSAALTRNIETTEMWFYRRMLRVSYTAHGTNISVLQRMGQERQLLRTIKERQTRFTGHIIRKGELEDLILAGKVHGKKARGGQRLPFLNQVMENTGLTSPRTIWDAARNRTLKIKTS